MEARRVRALLIVGLVLGMLAGQSATALSICYVKCFALCVIKSFGRKNCALECLPKCIGKKSGAQPDPHAYCKLGCAMNQCAHISTKKDIAAAKVESCVDSCSGLCTKNYAFA
ncbi:hypothetical protein PVL29_011469 [Vitis rotundifolia]|uniref:Thionin-like protein n=1 Tax=Vitis rotundifolia TaxID=103349 RepID=A0AA38ZPJ9_VITRO|nr:hypothetical protein PVL29_011469 [Vitis rotundifolia]